MLRLLVCLSVIFAAATALEKSRERIELEKYIRRSTLESRELDILVSPGIDPCYMNSSSVMKTQVGEEEVVWYLKDSLLFGLRGFDRLRQRVYNKVVRSSLLFYLLEGSTHVTLETPKSKSDFQIDILLPRLVLKLQSKYQVTKDSIQFTETTLRRLLRKRVVLQPSAHLPRKFVHAISVSFLKSVEDCIINNFLPAFNKGVNDTLNTRNLTKLIDERQEEPTRLLNDFRTAISNSAPIVIDFVKNLTLPNIQLHKKNGEVQFDLTGGHVQKLSRPKVFYVGKDLQDHTYNLQLLFRKLVIVYVLREASVPCYYYNVRFLLKIKQKPNASRLQVLRGTIFGVDREQPPRPSALLEEINAQLFGKLINFLQPKLQLAFSKAL